MNLLIRPPQVKGKTKEKKKEQAKEKRTQNKSQEAKISEKLMKFTPSKIRTETPHSKETPRKPGTTGKRRTPAMASPGGVRHTRTTDNMTMVNYTKYLEWHGKKQGFKIKDQSSGVLGKRSSSNRSQKSGGGKKK